MADKHLSQEDVLDLPVTRRKRFLAWLSARRELDEEAVKAARAGESSTDRVMTQVQLLEIWGEAAHDYVDPRLLQRPE